MTQLTILLADDDCHEVVVGWAGAQLLGDALLVRASASEGPALTLSDLSEVTVADHLAALTDLVEVRVAWCADDIGSPNAAAAVAFLDDVRSQVLGHQRMVGVAVFPALQPPPVLPNLSPDWWRFVMGPESPLVPGGPSRESSDRIAEVVHAACLLGGVYAGNMALPSLTGLQADEEHCITGFSSTLTGGLELWERTAQFIDETLPESSAADLWPADYTEHGSAMLLEACYSHVRGVEGGQLSYTHPTAPSFEQGQHRTLKDFWANFRSFLDFLFLHSKEVPWQAKLHNRVVDLLQGSDLGWEIERADDRPGLIPAADVWGIDSATTSSITAQWRDRANLDGELPSDTVWRDLLKCATASIDGGELAQAVERPSRHDQKLVANPRAVLDVADGDFAEETPGTIAGVEHEPCTPSVAQAAAIRVRLSLDTPGNLLRPTSTRGSDVTRALASEVSELETRSREDLAEQLGQPEPVGHRLSLLDRIRSDVLADSVTARLDAERWFGIAAGCLSQLIPLRSALFRFLAVTGTALSSMMVLGNAFFPQTVLGWLTQLGINATSGQVWAGIVPAATVLVSGPVVWFYYHYNQYHERSRRQTEARWLVFIQAKAALREAQRLANADRILRRWAAIIRGVYPLPASTPARRSMGSFEPGLDEQATVPVRLPASLTLTKATFPERDLDGWLRRNGAFVGWRQTALMQIVERHGSQGLFGDSSVASRPLALLHDNIRDVWSVWLGERIEKVWRDTRITALEKLESIALTNGSALSLAAYFERVASDDYLPGIAYGRPGKPQLAALAMRESLLSPTSGLTTDDVLRSDSRLYIRTLEARPSTPASTQPTARLRGERN